MLSASPQKQILIVEDDHDIRAALTELLEDEGYLVEGATNGKEGIEFLRATPRLPDLILLDLMMPVKDGYEFKHEQDSDASFSRIPVVIMSAHGNVDATKIKIPAKEFLKKPLEIDRLLNLVAKFA